MEAERRASAMKSLLGFSLILFLINFSLEFCFRLCTIDFSLKFSFSLNF